MQHLPAPEFEQKICAPEDLSQRIAQLAQPLVFTNGCFDILHRGHVNTDASVKRQGKGDDRPINALENRLAVIAALQSVDLVTWFDEDTPAHLIELIQPQVLVKGGDWAIENIVGAKETQARGGKVVSIVFEHQTSTTQTLAKIREAKA